MKEGKSKFYVEITGLGRGKKCFVINKVISMKVEDKHLGIQSCDSCGYQFRWKEIQRANKWWYKPLVCKQCGLEHYITFRSRLIFGLINGLFVFLSSILSNVFSVSLHSISFIILVLIGVILITSNFLIFPYYTKYNSFQNNK
ncbi:hypothetical protein HHO41_12820 [Bacillus sp. DNRA2]|nr:hypothetical protein [Bacillus sp. DNRA2]